MEKSPSIWHFNSQRGQIFQDDDTDFCWAGKQVSLLTSGQHPQEKRQFPVALQQLIQSPLSVPSLSVLVHTLVYVYLVYKPLRETFFLRDLCAEQV